MKQWAIALLVFIIGLLVFVALLFNRPKQLPEFTLRPGDAVVVTEGKAIYDTNCASCHGKNLEGQADWKRRGADGYLPAPPHDDTGHTWHHSDKDLFELTKFGVAKFVGADYKTRMPAYQRVLSDSEIRAALSYIKSRWSPEIRRRHNRINAPQKR